MNKRIMNKSEEYFLLLMNQYYKAIGSKSEPSLYISRNLYKEHLAWLKERNIIAKRYVEFLNYLGKDITTSSTAEIGKGMYDSIALPFNTTLITPYEIINSENRVYNYYFLPLQENGCFIKWNANKNEPEIKKVPEDIKTLMTNNPYREKDLVGWEDINNNKLDIIVGMYGHIFDNDKESKLKQLKDLKEKLISSDYILDFDYDRDAYFIALASDKEKYVKVK